MKKFKKINVMVITTFLLLLLCISLYFALIPCLIIIFYCVNWRLATRKSYSGKRDIYLKIVDPVMLFIQNILFEFKIPKIVICISVDTEMRNGNPNENIESTFKLFDNHDLRGKVTWFVEESAGFSTKYSDLLKKIIFRGDDVQLHVHTRPLNQENEEKLEKQIPQYKHSLEKCIRAFNDKYSVIGYRNGHLFVDKKLFLVLEKLGFKFDSSVGISKRFEFGQHNGFFDNTDIPQEQNTYYIQDGNYKKFTSEGGLLEFPVYFPPLFKLREAVAKSEKNVFVISMFFHNYEVTDVSFSDRILSSGYWGIKDTLYYLDKNFPNAEWMTLSDAYRYTIK